MYHNRYGSHMEAISKLKQPFKIKKGIAHHFCHIFHNDTPKDQERFRKEQMIIFKTYVKIPG